MALTSTVDGSTYRLTGRFLILEQQDPEAEPLRVLVSDEEVAASELSTSLPVGDYWVFLASDWTLQRQVDGAWLTVEANLATDNPLPVDVSSDTTTTARFVFDTVPAQTETGGELVIDFGVNEQSLCGNAVLEGDEACDDGAANGLPNQCDTSCAFHCEGACPVRVDPGAAEAGSGDDWSDPMNNLQAAMTQQATLGGGAIWVLGGEFEVLTTDSATLLTFPSDVQLYGGFQGTELAPEARDSTQEPTVLQRTSYAATEPLLVIDGQSNVHIDGIEVRDEAGPTLLIDESDVLLTDFSYEGNWLYGVGIETTDSRVRLQSSWLDVVTSDVVFVNSDVSIVDTALRGDPWIGTMVSRGSRLLYDRVDSALPLSVTEGSNVFINASTLRERFERGGIVSSFSNDEPSRITVSDSTFYDTFVALTPLQAQSVFVWNSTFVRLRGGRAGGNFATARAIEGFEVEVALSTFYDNYCDPVDGACSFEIWVGDNGFVHNSLFVNEYEEQFLAVEDPAELAVSPNGDTSGNCSSHDLDAFAASTEIPQEVLAVEHPCIDGGDAEALETSRQRLLSRAADFAEAPFGLSLSIYEDADWWRAQTVLQGSCSDANEPDPGRHLSRVCEP